MDVKIDVEWLNKGFHLEAKNEEGGIVRIDGDREVGGLEGGISPMQMLLAGAGGCSAIDVISILEKQKQQLESLKVEIVGDRQQYDAGYSDYKSMHLHFILSGELDPKKVKRAIDLSMTKYCSVSKILEQATTITYDFEIR